MWIGCFGELVFSVSSRRIFTPDGISGSTGSEWVTHNVIGGKPKSEMTGAKLKKYKFTVTLDSKLGEPPRIMLALIHKMVEEGRVDYLIIGSAPVGMCQYKMTDVSEEWECVAAGGKLVRCKVEITLEEYV